MSAKLVLYIIWCCPFAYRALNQGLSMLVVLHTRNTEFRQLLHSQPYFHSLLSALEISLAAQMISLL